MLNVNNIIEEIKKTDALSRSWRVASSGASYAPVEGEVWRISPTEPFGNPLGGQTAVRGIVAGQDRAFWPSWLVKVFPCPEAKGSSKVTLRGHLLDGKPISSIPLEELLDVVSSKDLRVASVEAALGLKKTYTAGTCDGCVEEVIKLYSWETVERVTTAEETPTEE